jgi:hypothetical protein
MRPQVIEPAIPFTRDRAATELAQSRRHLTAARESLELALQILSALDEMPADVVLFEEMLGGLEQSEAVLRKAVPTTRG